MRVAVLALAVAMAAVAVTLALRGPEQAPPPTFHDAVPSQELSTGPAVTPTRLSRAFRIADAYWGSSRCRKITRRRRSLGNLLLIARTSWTLAPDGSYRNCVVTFNSDHRRLAFRLYCAAVVHELGHLAGFYEIGGRDNGAHSSSRRNVMFPRLTRRNVPHVCKRDRDHDL